MPSPNVTVYRLVSVGVSVGSSMHERCEGHPKRHTKKKESEAVSETDGLCRSVHPNMELWGIGFGGVPYRLCRFHELLQSSRQLLTTSATHMNIYQP